MGNALRKIRNRLLNTNIKQSLERIERQNNELRGALEAVQRQVRGLQNHNEIFTDISTAPIAKGGLRLQQQAGAKMLELFDAICRKEKLDYWLGAGNLIGIVRHNGEAVPWDDDVDVYMPREDFEKATKILPKIFKNSDFGLVDRGFSLKIARYKSTAVSFDIFPIDQYYEKVEGEEAVAKLHEKIVKSGLYSNSEWIDAAGYGPSWSDFLVPVWEGKDVKTPEKIKEIKEESLKKWNESLMKGNTPAKDGQLVKGFEKAAFPAKQYSWSYDWVFPLQRATYMGVEVNIPNNPDKYLRSQYGDYWGFPTSYHRHTSHFESKYENLDDLSNLASLGVSRLLGKDKS